MNVTTSPIIVLKGRSFDLSSPLVMAIVNATHDSFYPSSRNATPDLLKFRIDEAVSQGADILDIGGCSTRPDASPVPEDEELDRVSLAFSLARSIAGDIPTSVDTFRASVARLAVNDFGCDIINDISAFTLDPELLPTVAQLQRPYILTHSAGIALSNDLFSPDDTPEDLFLSSVLRFFARKIDQLRSTGFNNNVIIDPGFGFSKNLRQNYFLLRNLSLLRCFNEPILVGLSRKSMIYRPLNLTPEQALNGTTALNTLALNNGANILRVHDVAEAIQIRQLYKLTLGK
ncbi:MAG: dihydropteroate synthase [Paludibacteraceae bacterium]|nr:dihydropteroate synthase [Paludibacteraceae bacterium]